MEAYIEEVRRLEERFDGLQTEHVPRAKNSIADHLSKCDAQKLPVGLGTFVLHLSQPSVSPATLAAAGGNITVTYNPGKATGSHSATLCLASAGAQQVNVALTGTATSAAVGSASAS